MKLKNFFIEFEIIFIIKIMLRTFKYIIMIAWSGIQHKDKKYSNLKIDKFWRTDEVEI